MSFLDYYLKFIFCQKNYLKIFCFNLVFVFSLILLSDDVTDSVISSSLITNTLLSHHHLLPQVPFPQTHAPPCTPPLNLTSRLTLFTLSSEKKNAFRFTSRLVRFNHRPSSESLLLLYNDVFFLLLLLCSLGLVRTFSKTCASVIVFYKFS